MDKARGGRECYELRDGGQGVELGLLECMGAPAGLTVAGAPVGSGREEEAGSEPKVGLVPQTARPCGRKSRPTVSV